MDFYIPKHKWDLVDLLKHLYPVSKLNFTKMKKERLYAIYMTTRRLRARVI